MAMIKCPNCDADISDKAIECPHCGYELVSNGKENNEIICPDCGFALPIGSRVCMNCGCPIDEGLNNVDKITIGKFQASKKMAIGIAVAVCIVIVTALGIKSSNTNAEINDYNTYIDYVNKARLLMLNSGSDAESLCILTSNVWRNAIYEESDIETDKYTKNGYSFVSDFNEALSNLYADGSTKSTISNIESSQQSVKSIMKELQNPPEGLENCYDTISDLYESYSELCSLATNPKGNYSSFTSSENEAVSEFMSTYERLDSQIPEKK